MSMTTLMNRNKTLFKMLFTILSHLNILHFTQKIDNKLKPVPLYVIKNGGVDAEDIYVTGSHLVFNKETKTFITVENYQKAVKCNIQTDWFSCLITSDNRIQLGTENFWDWEDHYLKSKVFNAAYVNM